MTTLSRAQLNRGIVGIDTTARSARGIWQGLAPRWEMVAGYKDRSLTDEAFTALYEQILDRVPESTWGFIAQMPTRVFCCYCPDEWFCHTQLLINYAIRRWPDRFIDGRMNPPLMQKHPIRFIGGSQR